MLAHLGEDSANVEVDVARVRNLQAIVDGLLAEVQVVVFDLEGLLQVGEGAPQLLRPTEHASEVVVGDGFHAVVIF